MLSERFGIQRARKNLVRPTNILTNEQNKLQVLKEKKVAVTDIQNQATAQIAEQKDWKHTLKRQALGGVVALVTNSAVTGAGVAEYSKYKKLKTPTRVQKAAAIDLAKINADLEEQPQKIADAAENLKKATQAFEAKRTVLQSAGHTKHYREMLKAMIKGLQGEQQRLDRIVKATS